MRGSSLVFGISLSITTPLSGQDLDDPSVRVPLDSALRIAQGAATGAFPELSEFGVYSITPRVLLADPGGLHWQVLWRARAFPHRRWLVMRVYMGDGHTAAERGEDGPPPEP